ncbi:cyanophycinase [Massilia sp. PWRC2]|uniref:cyanophycinase n=1 Tax=Massilia sp. PWRC2 TaxID=2804626 RepID=UPI003CF7B7BD
MTPQQPLQRRLFWPVRLALAVLLWSCAALALADGSLVIIGGALRADNAEVWQRIVTLAGGPDARIAVIPAAAGNPNGSGARLLRTLGSYGAAGFLLPLSPKLPGDVRQAANDAALVAQIDGAGGVYFLGGDQARIVATLRNADGANSAVLDAIWRLYRRGGVIAGTSAGAAIMSSTMFDNAGSVLSVLQRGVVAGGVMAPGLGFIGDQVFVDQHLLVRGRFARMLPLMLERGYRRGIGVDENTALVVGPGRDAEVIGYKGVIMLELDGAEVDRTAPALNVRNATISYLDHGDRVNLASGALTPSADKAGGKVDPAAPDYRGALLSTDILGNTSVVDLMARLIDSDQPVAIGLAFAGPGSEAGPGFEFRFSRTAASSGYVSASSEALSVYRLRLDVRPVALKWPDYAPWRPLP